MSAEEQALSKSARKRANQKERAAEKAAPEAAPPPPAPAPKAKAQAAPKGEAAPKGKAKAAPAPEPEPKAKAKGKAKAEPKAAPAPEPAPAPAPKAKADAKAKAKSEPKAAAAPAPEAAQAKPKAKGKAKAKKEEDAPVKKPAEPPQMMNFEMDDGKGGEWEVASALSKKALKRKEQIEEKKKKEEDDKKAAEKEAKATAKEAAKAATQTKANPKAQAKAETKADAKPAAATPSVAVVSAATAAAKDSKEPEKPKEVDPNISATVQVPSEKIGRVIGPKGSNIALIKEKTGVKTIDTAVDIVTIVGLPDTVPLAEAAIRELIEKGYMSLAFEDFKQGEVLVSPNSIPNIIGERGAIIQVIKKECKVEIDIPPVPKGSNVKQVKVNVAGEGVGVEKAKEIINSIALHQHHEVTHPGFTHQEMEVEEHNYRFVIGKGGSEMRHIQNNFKVKVNIPRDTSVSDKVLIVGEERDVERAVKYIEKILYDAQQPKGRGAPDKAEDTWGEDGPEEAWMSAYMYKRR